MTTKICIVTPDTVGPVKNGGIGTHCYNQAKFLAAQDNTSVTLLFTSDLQFDLPKVRDMYAELGVDFVALNERPGFPYEVRCGGDTAGQSTLAHQYLMEHDFDIIHFQDWGGHGFVPIQAKQTGQGYENTVLTVTMHSPTQWHQEGMEQWSGQPENDMVRLWTERYTCQHADVLLSPTHHMFEWAQAHHWELAQDRRVVRLLYTPRAKARGFGLVRKDHLVFFGRLEARKGLHVFCEAVKKVLDIYPDAIRKISFLGKIGGVGGVPADDYIRHTLGEFKKLDISVQTDLNTFQAMHYIRETGGIVVIPSLLDNSPYTVIECIENCIPFLASKVGGIPELASEAVLFAPKAADLAAKLVRLESMDFASLEHHFANAKSEVQHQDLQESLATQAQQLKTQQLPVLPNDLISICVPYYNHADFLKETLDSLAVQDYPNLEVLVVNDGSTDERAIETFEKLQQEFPRFTFLTKENGGLGDCRNYAASHAKGEYLVFNDSDNIATPTMISELHKAIIHSQADCVTCHFNGFDGAKKVTSLTTPLFRFAPLGGCIEFGALANVFGDANFIIKKSTFQELDGFTTDRLAYEDWEFLAKLNLRGYTQRVVPQPLFWYRVTPDQMSQTCNTYLSRKRVLRPYYEHAPHMGFLLSELTLPFWENYKHASWMLGSPDAPMHGFLPGSLQTVINSILPKGSTRRDMVKKLASKLLR